MGRKNNEKINRVIFRMNVVYRRIETRFLFGHHWRNFFQAGRPVGQKQWPNPPATQPGCVGEMFFKSQLQ